MNRLSLICSVKSHELRKQLMQKIRIAAAIAGIVITAVAITFALVQRSDHASGSDDARSRSVDNIPAPEPTMTIESIPQPRQEGLQPPPSDVAGISKP
jgi:hypothetical protein